MTKNSLYLYSIFLLSIQCSSVQRATSKSEEVSPVTEESLILDNDSNSLFMASEPPPTSSPEDALPPEPIDSSKVWRQKFLSHVEQVSTRFAIKDQVPVRDKPSMNGKIIRFLSKGEKIHVDKETDLWAELSDGFFVLKKDLIRIDSP